MDIDKELIARLTPEINTDPLGRNYAGMSDKELLVSLHEVNRTEPTSGEPRTELDVIASFEDTTTGLSVLEKMEDIAVSNKLLARLLAWMKPNSSGLDVSLPVVRQLVESLVSANPSLPQEFADAILNLGKRPCSRAVEIKCAGTNEQHIYIVRKQNK